MSFIGVDIIGAEGLIKDFDRYSKESEKAIDNAVRDTSFAIEKESKGILQQYLMTGSFIVNLSGKKAAGHRGSGGAGLLGSIIGYPGKIMEGFVIAAKHYAAYIEFGIGELVFTSKEFSSEEKEVAAQFRGTKKVHGFKGVSYLGTAATNQSPKLIERIQNNLNAIK